MTAQEKQELKSLKSCINSPKHELLQLCRKVEAISPRQGEELSRIIGRLEWWQNKK